MPLARLVMTTLAPRTNRTGRIGTVPLNTARANSRLGTEGGNSKMSYRQASHTKLPAGRTGRLMEIQRHHLTKGKKRGGGGGGLKGFFFFWFFFFRSVFPAKSRRKVRRDNPSCLFTYLV